MLRGASIVKCVAQPKFSATCLKVKPVKTSTFRPVAPFLIKATTTQKLYRQPSFVNIRSPNSFVKHQQVRYFSTNEQTETTQTEATFNVEGNNVPSPIPTFDEIPNFPPALRENIKNIGWKHLIKVQQYAIPAALHNRDLLISSQTGTGKTAAFLIPMMMNILQDSAGSARQSRFDYTVLPRGLILVPTRELAQQVAREAEKLSAGTDVRTFAVFGGVNLKQQINQMAAVRPDILVATPGRFIDLRSRGTIATSRVNHVVLDEGDMMLDMGFMPQVQDILGDPALNPNRQLCFFSATFPRAIKGVAEEFLRDPVKIFVGLNKPSSLITQQVVYTSGNSEKETLLLDFVRNAGQGSRILVFAETKKRTDALFHYLRFNGIRVACIHGDHIQTERDMAVEAFGRGEVNVLVATNVASRGLDIKGVSHVVNYDFPSSMEPYIHRIGRTGRAGARGTSLSFFTDADFELAEDLKQVLKESNQPIPDFLNQGRQFIARNLSTNVDQAPPAPGGFAPRGGYSQRGYGAPPPNPYAPPQRGSYGRPPGGYQQSYGGFQPKQSYNRPYQPSYQIGQQGGYQGQPGGYQGQQGGYQGQNQGFTPSYNQGFNQSYGSQRPPNYPPMPNQGGHSQNIAPGQANRGNLDLMSLLNDENKEK